MIVLIAMPMVAATIAVVALATTGRRLRVELDGLRSSLRRMGAATIAADELNRSTATVGEEAVRVGRAARAVLGRPRSGAPRPPR